MELTIFCDVFSGGRGVVQGGIHFRNLVNYLTILSKLRLTATQTEGEYGIQQVFTRAGLTGPIIKSVQVTNKSGQRSSSVAVEANNDVFSRTVEHEGSRSQGNQTMTKKRREKTGLFFKMITTTITNCLEGGTGKGRERERRSSHCDDATRRRERRGARLAE